ncbi:MAG: exodeoxyribonuclease V subunit gamma [Kiritimatiellae bacterium]|nr:exodeoxyribonuclease V subunit gamma [Kiritimatiellia bacterium]
MLTFHKSNRLEHLADALAEIVAQPLSYPLARETVLVLSRPMQHWVSLQLAEKHGICANMDFPFPLKLLGTLFNENLDLAAERTAGYEARAATWSVMEFLGNHCEEEPFQHIRAYLQGDDTGLKRYLLAARIANLLDQYTVYRPLMMQDWQKDEYQPAGPDEAWQAILWQDLVGRHGPSHHAAMAHAFLKRFGESEEPPNGLPERISLFGVCALPQFYLSVFQCLARWIPIHVFMLAPCRLYWGEIKSRRDIVREKLRGDGKLNEDEEHYETLNSLLASMGKLGKEFMDMVLEPDDCVEEEHFEPPAANTVLAAVQREILDLTEPDTREVAENDGSIQVHGCHGPMREVEVLQDRLLDLFERYPDLEPRDIIVMAPDIESYAPQVQAVFGMDESAKRHIPYCIADRSARYASSVVNAFLGILDLAGARHTSTELMTILETEPVSRQFGLDPEAVEHVRNWVAETRVHWGLDEADRLNRGLPESAANTWKWALDRMLLGYALPGEGTDVYEDILPYDEIEGGEADALGALARFVTLVSEFDKEAATAKKVPDWTKLLNGVLESCIHVSADTQDDVFTVRRALNELEQAATTAEFEQEVSLKVVRAALEGHLVNRIPLRFLSYGVNFSAFVPLRSIPFRVVCLLGMNDADFPRMDHPLSFDLIAGSPKTGDRSRRADDRYLFLEAILSARDVLYISYVGKSLRDDSDIPPSVLVSELVDYVARDDKALRERLVTAHPLQPFSPLYFQKEGGPRLFSYSEDYCVASTTLAGEKRKPDPFFTGPVALPEEDELNVITIGDLCSFFTCPVRFLLQRRFDVHLLTDKQDVEEDEGFALEKLEDYLLGNELLEMYAKGIDPEHAEQIMRGRGCLPHGTPGSIAFQSLSSGVRKFMSQLQVLKADPREHIDIDKTIEDVHFTGRLNELYADHMLRYRFGSLRASDQLKAWIEHLFLCAHGENAPTRTILKGREQRDKVEFSPVSGAENKLAPLVRLYREGLSTPLRFFPAAALAYAETAAMGEDEEKAIAAALTQWEGVRNRVQGERDKFPNKEYYQVAFGELSNEERFDTAFRTLAVQVFQPMLEARETTKKTKKKSRA